MLLSQKFIHRLGLAAILAAMLLVYGCQPSAPLAAPSPTTRPPAATSPAPGSTTLADSSQPAQISPTTTPPEITPGASPTAPASGITDLPAALTLAATATEAGSPMQEIDWRTAPIMPEVNQHVFEIYQNGQAQGRDPKSFSVIGDCQAIPFVFMGPYERGELQPDSSENYLWDAIHYFKGSFTRSGMAVRGGFTAASMLSPLHADPQECLSGETPLTCEYRLHNPAFVLINLETWLDPATIERYEVYLRKILDYVLEKGSVPILITAAVTADGSPGKEVINPAIVRLAYEYNVPLVNFWKAAQYLENRGIDPEREGFHLSHEGYRLKNKLALRALYTIWSAVEHRQNLVEVTPNATSLPSATPLPQVSPTPQAALQFTRPDCSSGCLYFGMLVSQDGQVTPNGVFAFNYAAQQLTQVLEPGFNLQDVSEDGQKLLINEGSKLYELDLARSSSRLISQSFYSLGAQGAYWDQYDSQVIYLDQDHPIQTETGSAITLLPSQRDGALYFESGSCQAQSSCQPSGVYRLSAGEPPARLDAYVRPVFSPDGQRMAFIDEAASKDEHINYVFVEIVEQGIKSRRLFYLPTADGFMVHTDISEYAFSPDSSRLFIINDVYSDYYERSLRLGFYMLDLTTGILYDLGDLPGAGGSLFPHLTWDAEGESVWLLLERLSAEGEYILDLYIIQPASSEQIALYSQAIFSSTEYFFLTNLYRR